jgi:gluconate 2-dehydrogenase gamma chain
MKVSDSNYLPFFLDGEWRTAYSHFLTFHVRTKMNELSRRNFLLRSGSGLGAAWISLNWTSVLAAATHAHEAAKSGAPAKFEFLTPEEAVEIEAITARIIPTDEMPGAREAGAVYFIDRSLMTYASDNQKDYRKGLPELQDHVHDKFPGLTKFSAATPEQQDQILLDLDPASVKVGRGNRARAGEQNFIEIVRQHTIAAFLIDPDSDRRGNKDGVGWKVIGREREHMFQSPFGYYDKDYPGWQPPSKDADRK